MKKSIITLSLFCTLLVLSSCGEQQNEDIVQKIDKSGAIEISVNIGDPININGSKFQIVTMKKNIYSSNLLYKTTVICDTIPCLGTITTTDDNDNTIQIPKEYEIYFTAL